MNKVKKAAFLLLDNIHHVYHIVPIAYSLSYFKDYKVTIYYSTLANESLAKEIGKFYPEHNCSFVFIKPSLFFNTREKIKNGPYPSASKVLMTNFKQLMAHDLIVSADLNVLWLIKRKVNTLIKFVFCFHGAGDREYPFNSRLDMFDLLLVPGEKYKDRILSVSAIDPLKIQISGCSKFDLTLKPGEESQAFSNTKKTVIYNPHFEEGLSSWSKWGVQLLEWFYAHPEYNLIFAPHIMLYSNVSPQDIVPQKFFKAKNIYIADPADKRCVDMSFVKEADIYIGDVSSQVYEFLFKSRPCFFLNAHCIVWDNLPDYVHWKMGEVIDGLPQLFDKLPDAKEIHKKFVNKQEEMFSYSFFSSDEPAAMRAAKLMDDFLVNGPLKGKLRILLTNEHEAYGGGHDTYIDTLAHGLRAQEEEVYVAAPETSRLKNLISPARKVHFIGQNYPAKIKQIYQIYKEAKKLRILLKQIQFDVVQTSGSADHRLVIYASLFLPNKPKIIFTRHNLKKVRGSTVNRLNNHCDLVVAVSDAAKKSLTDNGVKTPIEVVHNGIDTNYFDCQEVKAITRESLGFAVDDIIFVSNAGCEELKGWLLLTQAIAQLPENLRAKLKVILIGNRPFDELYQKYVVDIGMKDQVIFTGFQEDIRPYVCLSDIGFVLSTKSEALSFACREMMALGKPMLVSDYGGLVENVTDNKEGWVCKAGSIESIQEKLRLIIEQPNEVAKKSKAAKQRSEQEFGVSQFLTKVTQLYKKILR